MANSEPSSQDAKPNDLPDLYRLLGIPPLEAEASKIEQALEVVRRKALAAKESDPKLAQRASRIFALGQKNLLDAERKAAYDRAWVKSFGNPTKTVPIAANVEAPVAVAVAASELTWDMRELESYLPEEDPRAPFDFAGFLEYSENLPETNVVADYERLQVFLGGVVTSTVEAAAPESVSAVSLLANSAPVESSTTTGGGSHLTEQFAAPANPRVPQRRNGRAAAASSASLAKQMRQKRSRSFLLSVVGMMVGVGVVLGATLYLLRKNDAQDPNQQTLLAQGGTPTPALSKGMAPVQPAVPRGSGLPRVSGLGDGDMAAMPADPNMSMTAANPPPEPAAMQPQPQPEPPATEMPAPEPPATEMAATEPMTPAEPAMAADPALTDDEKAEWQKSMTAIRELLGNQEYDNAKQQLDASEKLAKTSVQRSQLKRLNTVWQLTSEYHNALVSAVAGLGAGESFVIGKSASASFIEGSATEIAIRFNGQNRTYKFTELPMGLANGLVDLKMDTENAKSLARKAAFALVHPKSSWRRRNLARCDEKPELVGL